MSITGVALPPAVVAVTEVTGTSVITLSGSLSAVPFVLMLPIAGVPVSSVTELVLGVATGGSFTGVTWMVVVTVSDSNWPLAAASLLASRTRHVTTRSVLPGFSPVLRYVTAARAVVTLLMSVAAPLKVSVPVAAS